MRSGDAVRHSATIALGPVRAHCARTSGTWLSGSRTAVASQRRARTAGRRSRGSVVGPSRTTAITRGIPLRRGDHHLAALRVPDEHDRALPERRDQPVGQDLQRRHRFPQAHAGQVDDGATDVGAQPG